MLFPARTCRKLKACCAAAEALAASSAVSPNFCSAAKVLSGGNFLLGGQNRLPTDARRVFAGELSLALEFASGIQTQVEHVAEGAGAGGENSEKQEEEATRQISPTVGAATRE